MYEYTTCSPLMFLKKRAFVIHVYIRKKCHVAILCILLSIKGAILSFTSFIIYVELQQCIQMESNQKDIASHVLKR